MYNSDGIEEKLLKAPNGMIFLVLNTLLILAAIFGFIVSIPYDYVGIMIICMLYAFIVGPVLYIGLRSLRPNEAYVLTLFGKYYGTLKGPGFFYVNPFSTAARPGVSRQQTAITNMNTPADKTAHSSVSATLPDKKISLKVMTLDNNRQKINDLLGNPVEIGVVVIWRVVNTAKALFSVDNYMEFLSIQADSAIRNIARMYPYDVTNDDDEKNDDEMSLRASSQEVAEKLKKELQDKVDIAGIDIIEARITHLAYATEIAAAMLQRQQARAVIAARRLIVEGAVGMVEMALNKLGENGIIQLDEERKAAMVSNLLVVLCGNKDAQPIVNSGSLY